LKKKNLNLFFVFDQYNFIPEEKRNEFPFSLPFRIEEFFSTIFIQKKIYFVLCSSNNSNRNKEWEKLNLWAMQSLFEQFTDDQINELISLRKLEFSETELEEIRFLTNRIPLEINDFLNSRKLFNNFREAVNDFEKTKTEKYKKEHISFLSNLEESSKQSFYESLASLEFNVPCMGGIIDEYLMYRESIPNSLLVRVRALTPIIKNVIYMLNSYQHDNLLSLVKNSLSNNLITNDAKEE